jgi:aspartyl-tRNA(Asn)/glutamyl-tRNA(Gln) amidotransferase subunit A
VGDALAMASALAQGPELHAPLAPVSRILFIPRFAHHPVDPAIAEAAAQAARDLSSIGHRIEESAPVDWAEEVNELWPSLACAGLAWMMERASSFPEFRLLRGSRPDTSLCSQAAQASIREGESLKSTTMFAALQAIRRLRKRIDELFAVHDFLLTPATAALPWQATEPHPTEIDGQLAGPRAHAIYTPFANAAGLPAIALPSTFARALPTGFQLIGRRGADAALLSLALQYEQCFPLERRWPTLRRATLATA